MSVSGYEAPHPYVRLARKQIEAYVMHKKLLSAEEALLLCEDSAIWTPGRACFVSIKTTEGHLRGCIGTILPSHSTLADELLANAVAAASRDPRFLPLTEEELPNIHVSVDILSLPELVRSESELDPKRYGVIVEKGNSRGVLLPNLEGVESTSEQLAIACAKAGIRTREGATLYRFVVERYPERDVSDERT
ncbi:AmmeMemoRadiSam system protein A [Aminiphilus sp.]|jgi:AmmeMemoRadiSam system protein A|uniref:AmmeMemoRadiSam system protein A n=1 Tax=Aminiphilus sp. TaxID=1872488 RepID=UPI002617A33B|nr:AmmeMemoRadiSam system protein A [Aminiphilus sp.]